MSGNFAPPTVSPIVRLSYTAATDLANAQSTPAATWTDIGTNQTFTVASANSRILVAISGCVLVGNDTTLVFAASRALFDSAGTPSSKLLGGAIVYAAQYQNCLSGGGTLVLTGLAPGSHTLKLQVYTDVAASAFCRAATKTPTESLQFNVLEFF